MKVETVTIQVQRYTDDDGTPVCGKCERIDEGCKQRKIQIKGADFFSFPLSSCPIWHNTVNPKWAAFRDWLISGGYISAEDDGCPTELLREMVAWEAARK